MAGLPEPDPAEATDAIADSLAQEFPDSDQSEVHALVAEAYDRISEESKAPAFISILAERHVRQVLEQRGGGTAP